MRRKILVMGCAARRNALLKDLADYTEVVVSTTLYNYYIMDSLVSFSAKLLQTFSNLVNPSVIRARISSRFVSLYFSHLANRCAAYVAPLRNPFKRKSIYSKIIQVDSHDHPVSK